MANKVPFLPDRIVGRSHHKLLSPCTPILGSARRCQFRGLAGQIAGTEGVTPRHLSAIRPDGSLLPLFGMRTKTWLACAIAVTLAVTGCSKDPAVVLQEAMQAGD